MKVVLISNDGQEFEIEKEAAICSNTLRDMMQFDNDQLLDEDEEQPKVTLPTIEGKVLKVVVEYLKYKQQYKDQSASIPEFHVDPEIAIDVLRAADYLDC